MANSYREETAARESHREAFAGQGAVAELLVGSAMAKRMAAPWRIAIGKLSLARGAAAERHREAATAGKEGRATAGKKGLQGATGWSLFLMRPLCKLFLYL